MAMIQCPNCGENISDKAEKCIHCGYELKQKTLVICPECGTEVEEGTNICPNCGYPIGTAEKPKEDEPQKVEVTSVKIKPSISKKSIIIALILVVAIVMAAVGLNQQKKQNEIRKAEELSKQYKDNFELVTYSILSGAADAETCGNLIRKVWSNSIYEERDSSTDKYTRKDKGYGEFYDDFNIALGLLFADTEFNAKINGIETNQEEVATLMKSMKNPPPEWTDAYADLKSLHSSYLEFTNCVINPKGSLQTFSETFGSADTNLSNEYSKIKLYLE